MSRAVWWRGGANIPLEWFPSRTGGKKLETATIHMFWKIYCKGKKRNVAEAGSKGKFLFFEKREITVCFYDSRNYLAERKKKNAREKRADLLEQYSWIGERGWALVNPWKAWLWLEAGRAHPRRQEKQSEWSLLLGGEPMEILPIASILQWMSLRNKLWKGCREQTVYEIVA